MIRKEKKQSRSSQWEKKTEKSWTLFNNRLLYESLSNDNESLFYFSSSFAAQFSLFDIRDIKRGNGEQQIARDGQLNIYFKNNLILLVMSVTQSNFLNWQNVHMWHFIKVVVPTLISWSKTKALADYNKALYTSAGCSTEFNIYYYILYLL